MATRSQKIPLGRVNEMDFQEFTETFDSIIERTPLAAAAVWSQRPFESLLALHKAFSDFLRNHLSPTAAVGVIRCYPDLAGKLAESSQLSEESTREHEAAGLFGLSESEKRRLSSLNDRYKQKFNFPFVVCARENKVQSIFDGLEARLENAVADEERQALKEISKIAWHRLNDMIVANVEKDAHFATKL